MDSSAKGKEVLQTLVRSHRSEYDALTPQEKLNLIQELNEHKANKACGLRTSVKAKINDVTHTMSAIENEVCAPCGIHM